MKGNRGSAAVGVAKMPMAAFLPNQSESVAPQCADQLAGGKGTKAGVPDFAHTLTAMRGPSEMVTLAGSGPPSA